jgi:hypothetical protein
MGGGDLIKVGGAGDTGDALVRSRAEGLRVLGGTVPLILVRLGEPGLLRFLEFFTVNISNVNTRAAYGRAARSFLRWCEGRGLAELKEVKPFHVAAYIEELGRTRTKRGTVFSKPGVKQHLACIRMLFDWLIVGQVVPDLQRLADARLDAFLAGCVARYITRHAWSPERRREASLSARAG